MLQPVVGARAPTGCLTRRLIAVADGFPLALLPFPQHLSFCAPDSAVAPSAGRASCRFALQTADPDRMSWWSRVFGGKSPREIKPQRLDYLNEALMLERQGDYDAALTSYRLALRDK